MLSAAKVFQDNMVLQRQKPICLWGQAAPGARVEASLGGDTAAACADGSGVWRMALPPREAETELTLRLRSGGEQLAFRHVAVGEVWLSGGQSNMEFHMKFDRDFDAAVASQLRDVRFYDVPEIAYDGEEEDFDYSQFGFWRRATAADLPWFSAVGYYFADAVGAALDVPVGIVGCNWGGTMASAWTDPRYLENTEGDVWLREYEENLPRDMAAYEMAFAANPNNNRVTLLDDPMNVKIMRDGLSREEQAAFTEQIRAMAGVESLGEEAPPLMNYGPKSEQNPGTLYDHMLKTVAPYSLRGVIWYQGESDERHPEVYATVFSRMIQCWRDLWQEELPFLFVQLAPFEEWLFCTGRAFPLLRRQQELVSKTVSNVWMTASGDAGMQWDIHPKEKRPIGQRLALLALGHVYGKDLLCDAPSLLGAEKRDGALCLRFAHGAGLHLQGDLSAALTLLDGAGRTVAAGEAAVEGDTLLLRGCGDASTVSYAQTPFYRAAIFNGAGIPAIPFTITL